MRRLCARRHASDATFSTDAGASLRDDECSPVAGTGSLREALMIMHDFNGQLSMDRMRMFATQAAQHRLVKQARDARDRGPNPRARRAHPIALIAAAAFATDQVDTGSPAVPTP
jgi:hypothetical protein